MSTAKSNSTAFPGIVTNDYVISSLDDEIRVDKACVDLLRSLFQHLTRSLAMESGEAGEICHGADYFLREFIIADRKENLFTIDPLRVRQFAGNWYIVRVMEPNLKELQGILAGTANFYLFLAEQGLVDASVAAEIAERCADSAWYGQRIEDFLAISGDGYTAWRHGCPLEPVPDWP